MLLHLRSPRCCKLRQLGRLHRHADRQYHLTWVICCFAPSQHPFSVGKDPCLHWKLSLRRAQYLRLPQSHLKRREVEEAASCYELQRTDAASNTCGWLVLDVDCSNRSDWRDLHLAQLAYLERFTAPSLPIRHADSYRETARLQ